MFSDLVYKNLDWPEAIWEGWIAFEHKCGSVEELEACLDKVERARGQVGMRRAKEAEKAAYQQQAAVAAALPEPVTGEAMDVDAPVGGTKRKADAEDETPVAESSKKARIGELNERDIMSKVTDLCCRTKTTAFEEVCNGGQ